jgi:hypothetical protein
VYDTLALTDHAEAHAGNAACKSLHGPHRYVDIQSPCGRLQRLGAVENLGGNEQWESLGGRTKPGLQAVLRGEVAPTTVSGLRAVHTTVTRALGQDGTIPVLEALTVIIAHDLPTAEMTGEAPVDGRERAEARGEVMIQDPVAVVMTIGAEEVDRPTVATILIPAEAATIGIHVGVAEVVVIPDGLEDMTIGRCEVHRLRPVIVHLPVAQAVSGETASALAAAPTGHARAMESPPMRQQAPAWVGARVSTPSGPIVCASRV